ncbi:MAG: helix-turn-helix transcriptional regulator [Clostridia bacterium]|nr:helix-turn-helix transcriptional regulator [Clostridia bacterium]
MDQNRDRSPFYENVPQDVSPIRFRTSRENSPFSLHWHEHLELHYIIEGELTVRCENETVTVSKNSFLIVNSNELHEGLGGSGTRFYMLIPPTFFENKSIILKRVVKDAYLSDLAQKMICEYENQDDFTNFAMQGYAHLMLVHLCRHYVYESFDKRAWNSYSQRIVGLNKAVKYIHDNYQSDISLEELSRISNFNKYYFCNIFKSFTGESFKEYQNRIRIQKATELLCATDMSVTEIAFLCGFNDSNYFARAFKKFTDQTPRELRKNGAV